MQTSSSIRITYWAEQGEGDQLLDLNDINEFRGELEAEYPCAIHGRPGELGGLMHFVVEFVSSVSLGDIAQFVASGMAYDMLKEGTKGLVLRPFLLAYNKLKSKNVASGLDIDVLRLVLRDSIVVIYRMSHDSVLTHLETVVRTIAREYDHLALRSGEHPFTVHVPVFEDTSEERMSRFRVLLDVDETIIPKSADYVKLWGLEYDFARITRVFDVERGLLLDEAFLTQDQYDRLWRERNASGLS